MLFTTFNLHYFFVYVCYFNWKTLPEEITVAQLADLAGTPSVNVAVLTENASVRLSTGHVNHNDTVETCHLTDRVFINHRAMAKLARVPSTPSKDITAVCDRSDMV